MKKISQVGEVKRIEVKKSKLPGIVVAAVVIIIAVGIYLYRPSSKTVKETEAIKKIAVSDKPSVGLILTKNTFQTEYQKN